MEPAANEHAEAEAADVSAPLQSRVALPLLGLVCALLGLQFGVVAQLAWAQGGALAPGLDVLSDEVSATAGEFRVDESGAATYSVPLYVVPGTAGVAPQLSLNYSS